MFEPASLWCVSQGGSKFLILEGSRLLTLPRPLPFLGLRKTFHAFSSLFSELKPELVCIAWNQGILRCKCSTWIEFDHHWTLVQALFHSTCIICDAMVIRKDLPGSRLLSVELVCRMQNCTICKTICGRFFQIFEDLWCVCVCVLEQRVACSKCSVIMDHNCMAWDWRLSGEYVLGQKRTNQYSSFSLT